MKFLPDSVYSLIVHYFSSFVQEEQRLTGGLFTAGHE
jgi:hypothetical protein